MSRFFSTSRATVIACALALAAVATSGQKADAAFEPVTMYFQAVPNNVNNPTNIAAASTMFTVTLDDVGTNQVSFTFKKVGTASGSLTSIIFEDGSLFGIANEPISSTGIEWEEGVGENIPFLEASRRFGVDVNGKPKGLDVTGESVTIVFDLQAGKSVEDTYNALIAGLDGPDVLTTNPLTHSSLRIGIHVQSLNLDGESSEKLINGPPPVATPAPAGLLLALTGMPALGVGAWLRRRRTAVGA